MHCLTQVSAQQMITYRCAFKVYITCSNVSQNTTSTKLSADDVNSMAPHEQLKFVWIVLLKLLTNSLMDALDNTLL
jgi:hypothetical protein